MTRARRALGAGTVTALVLGVAAAVPAAAAPEVPAPAAAWSFDDAGGDVAVDSTGSGHDGEVDGGTWTTGRIDGALSIDGYDDGVIVQDTTDLAMESTVTVEARVRFAHRDGVQKIVERGGNYAVRVSDDGRMGFRWNGGQWQFGAPLEWEDGRWYHLVVVHDGARVTFYRDGEASGSAANTETVTPAAAPVYLGRGVPDWERTLDGTLDEVRLYDVPLTADQVRARYDAAPAQSAPAPRINAVDLSTSSLTALSTVELTADVDATFVNPDDPHQIDVRAEVRTPGGETVAVPGFRFQDFAVDGERVVESGTPVWTVRYTPPEPGAYRVRLHADGPGGTDTSAWQALEVTAAPQDERGFVRVDPDNPKYFQFARTGETFFPMGVNLDVPTLTRDGNHHEEPASRYDGLFGDGLSDANPAEGATPENLYKVYDEYRRAIADLAASGANAVRLRLDSWWLPLEIDPDYPVPGYPDGVPGFDVGRYHAANAWIADQVIELAEQHGLYVTPVTWNHHSPWGASIYSKPGHQDADMVERRLRYQVARWSYSTHMYGWGLFNETRIDPTGPFYAATIDWLRETDPNPHLVFNSYTPVDQRVAHAYRCDDDPDELKDCSTNGHFLDKAVFDPTTDMPLVLEEYGKKWYFRYPVDDDPRGLKAHEGLWASIAGHLSGALYWWQYTHLGPLDLYDDVYGAAAQYLSDVELGAYDWQAAELTQADGPGGLRYFGMTHTGSTAGEQPNRTTGPRALLWVVRTPSDEYTDRAPADGNVVTLVGSQPGRFRVVWTDTWTGEDVSEQVVSTDDGDLRIAVPDGVTRDVAAKVYGPLGETTLTTAADTTVYEPGQTTSVEVAFTNASAAPGVKDVELALDAPDGWTVEATTPTSFPHASEPMRPGDSESATFEVTAPELGYPGAERLEARAQFVAGDTPRSQASRVDVRYDTEIPPVGSFGPVAAPHRTFASTEATFGQREGTFLIDAGGRRIWENDNHFGAVYLDDAVGPRTSVTTTVAHQEDTDEAARAGIMLKNDITDTTSTGYALVAVTPGRGYVLNVDVDGDGGMDKSYRAGATSYPARLKLERDGDQVTGSYAGADGTWREIATVDLVAPADTQDVGLFNSSNNPEEMSRADFVGFDVSPG